MHNGSDSKIKIILDTDIADDIDDAIALSFALGSEEFELLGVTVVYGDVATRARVARRICRLWDRADVPVVCGAERPMGFDWFPGTTPEICSQAGAVADDAEPVPRAPMAADFIADTCRKHPGQVHVLTIGAITNVGAALCADPSLAGTMASVVSLAGYLPPRLDQPEWNVRYDPIAAQSVARSGVAWTAIGADVQGHNGLTPVEFAGLTEGGRAADAFLADLIVLMKRNKGAGNPAVKTLADVQSCHVADVMTLASLLIGERMHLQAGRVDVGPAGQMAFSPDASGPHRLATAALAEGSYRPEIIRRVLGR